MHPVCRRHNGGGSCKSIGNSQRFGPPFLRLLTSAEPPPIHRPFCCQSNMPRLATLFEADPLACPCRVGALWMLVLIERPEVIERILIHLGTWPASAHRLPRGVIAQLATVPDAQVSP